MEFRNAEHGLEHGLDVLLPQVMCAHKAAGGADVDRFLGLAQPLGLIAHIVEGDARDADVFQVHLQNGRKTQVPVGRRHHDLIRLREGFGDVGAFPLHRLLAAQRCQIQLIELLVVHLHILQGVQIALCQFQCAGLFPMHTAVDQQHGSCHGSHLLFPVVFLLL